jgi:hypothetical protein
MGRLRTTTRIRELKSEREDADDRRVSEVVGRLKPGAATVRTGALYTLSKALGRLLGEPPPTERRLRA